MKENSSRKERQKILATLPQGTKFVGHVVHLPETDEFLARYTENEIGVGYVWSKTIVQAKEFSKLKNAIKIATGHSNAATPCYLFDTGPQLFIFAAV